MGKLLINEILEALSCREKTFRTLHNFEIVCDERGCIRFIAGRNSIVLQIRIQGLLYALKCYNSPLVAGERLGGLIASLPDKLTIKPQILPEELWVDGHHTDVALYPWVEGRTLEWTIRKAIHDKDSSLLLSLKEKFIALAVEILESEWRHGDLKAENIVVRPNGEMVLVDCDSLYHPTLPKRYPLGTPPYIHPQRGDAYDSHIDDYSIALVVLSLEALARDTSLFANETMVALPTEGNVARIREVLATSPALLTLLDEMLAEEYKIANLKDLLQCITHR